MSVGMVGRWHGGAWAWYVLVLDAIMRPQHSPTANGWLHNAFIAVALVALMMGVIYNTILRLYASFISLALNVLCVNISLTALRVIDNSSFASMGYI